MVMKLNTGVPGAGKTYLPRLPQLILIKIMMVYQMIKSGLGSLIMIVRG